MPSFRRAAIASLFSFFLALPASAITLTPVLVDQAIDPGSVVQGNIRVVNDTEVPQTYYTSVQKFIPDGEEGHQSFLPEEDHSDLASWIRIDRPQVKLDPGEGTDVTWIASIPADAEPGGHYGAIFFSTQAPGQIEGVGVGAKTGSLVLFNVNGNVREDARLLSFDAFFPNGGRWTNRLPVRFQTRMQNDGSVHVLPIGTISIKNALGRETVRLDANPARSRSLPSSVRRIVSWWGESSDATSGSFLEELKAEWKYFALGRYTADLDLIYGRSGRAMSGQAVFWVIPWHLGIVALSVLALLVLLLKGYNRLIVRSALRRQAK